MGTGISYMSPMVCGIRWLPHRKGERICKRSRERKGGERKGKGWKGGRKTPLAAPSERYEARQGEYREGEGESVCVGEEGQNIQRWSKDSAGCPIGCPIAKV